VPPGVWLQSTHCRKTTDAPVPAVTAVLSVNLHWQLLHTHGEPATHGVAGSVLHTAEPDAVTGDGSTHCGVPSPVLLTHRPATPERQPIASNAVTLIRLEVPVFNSVNVLGHTRVTAHVPMFWHGDVKSTFSI